MVQYVVCRTNPPDSESPSTDYGGPVDGYGVVEGAENFDSDGSIIVVSGGPVLGGVCTGGGGVFIGP